MGREAALEVEATLALLLLRSTGAREPMSSWTSVAEETRSSAEPTVDLRRLPSETEGRRAPLSPSLLTTSSDDMCRLLHFCIAGSVCGSHDDDGGGGGGGVGSGTFGKHVHLGGVSCLTCGV